MSPKHRPSCPGRPSARPLLPFTRLSPLAAALLLAACAGPGSLGGGPNAEGLIPPPLFRPPELAAEGAEANLQAPPSATRRTVVTDVPQVPAPTRSSTVKPGTPAPAAGEAAGTTLAFDQLPLPTFIQVVFGNILKKNFSADPAVMTRTDLVTLRSGTPQTASQVLQTAQMLLKSYGVAVNDMGGGFYRIVPDTNQGAYQPEIRRGRAQPEVPLPLRPVFTLVEMSAVRHSEVGNWVRAMFGTRLTVQDDAGRNALLISGQSADVTAALEAIQVLDQPLMRARSSQMIAPSVLAVDDLARRLVEILSAQGYAVGVGAAPGQPISLVPIVASNALLVFAADAAVLAHVVAWATKLDSMENDNRRSGNYFSYEVKYADAQALSKTLQELLSGQAAPQQVPAGAVVVGAPRVPARIVVNPATNTLIVNTTNPDEYAQLLSLMKVLDKPSKSALIEVTVAEVRTSDRSQLGVDWGFGPTAAGAGTLSGGTQGGLSLGSGGLSLSFLNNVGLVRANLNALASNNRARILSTPRVMARNGEAATIQVGQEVPIITSQQSNTAASGQGSGVLQTVQYRNTGVILRVKPIIFAGRVELEVQQEVSTAASTTTGVSISPTFNTRKVDTKLSIRDGATVALGGLISRTTGSGGAGIPLLKDIPVVGQLFRVNSDEGDETELIILITPFVVENDLVAEQVTQAMRAQLGPWAQPAANVASPAWPKPPQAPTAQPPVVEEPPPAVLPLSVPQRPLVDAPAAGGVAPKVPPAVPAAPQAASGAPVPGPSPGLPAGTRQQLVTDAALLEELRRAAVPAQGAKAPPAAPKTPPAGRKPAR